MTRKRGEKQVVRAGREQQGTKISFFLLFEVRGQGRAAEQSRAQLCREVWGRGEQQGLEEGGAAGHSRMQQGREQGWCSRAQQGRVQGGVAWCSWEQQGSKEVGVAR